MLSDSGARAIVARVVDPVARGLLRIGVSPDAVTIIGTVGTSAAALTLFPRQQWLLGMGAMTLFVFSDVLDGTMARISGRSGPWGAFLDSTLDRVSDGAVFGGLLLGFALGGQPAAAAASLALLVGAMAVSYAKARAQSLGLDGDGGLAERTERLVLAGLVMLAFSLGVTWVVPAGLWAVAALVWATVVQRMIAARRSAAAGGPA